jgi:hypothetical protein
MRSRQLDTALTGFVGTVAAHLRNEVAGGAEVAFELGSQSGRTGTAATPLYCYRALTREFIEQRDADIKRLPGHEETAKLLEDFGGLDRYLVSVGVDVARVKGRARARAAISALVGDVFDEQTDFKVRPERLAAALRRLYAAAAARESETTLVATLHGVAIASEEIQLTKGLTIARIGAIDGLPDTTVAALTQREASEHLLVVHTAEGDDIRAAMRRGRAVLHDLLTALRLYGDGRIALGGVAWAQAAGGPWAPFALGGGGRVHGMLAVTAEQEDELRAFCNLVSRRAPHANALAWALKRYELGCERESVLLGLSDHLLALRALLEPEGWWSGMLAGRLAALCATPADRAALTERAIAAIALERAVAEGTAELDSTSKALADEISTHLKALLRDVICGHLGADLAGFADELLAREEGDGDDDAAYHDDEHGDPFDDDDLGEDDDDALYGDDDDAHADPLAQEPPRRRVTSRAPAAKRAAPARAAPAAARRR